jgi:Arc/MetJ-type ribon-helix-helix transcriptional regulator
VSADPMPIRSVRVPDGTWAAAQAKADERRENLSDVIRKALEAYARKK